MTSHKGEANPRHKLTADEVRKVRALSKEGFTNGQIVYKLGGIVGKSAIQKIVSGRRWASLK